MSEHESINEIKAHGQIIRSLNEIVEISDQRLRRISRAIDYIDRILAHNPNGAQLMFLTEVKRILTGESDGRTIAEASDG